MAQISYDDQYYYKLVTDAKNQETTKTILGIVPHSGSSSDRCCYRYGLFSPAYQLPQSYNCQERPEAAVLRRL